MNNDIMSILEFLERDRGIEKEILMQAIENAILQAIQKTNKLNLSNLEDVKVEIDRITGSIEVYAGTEKITTKDFGRIAAQTAKQVIMQKIKEAEVSILYDTYKKKEGELVSGVVRRFERGNVILEIGKIEAIIPRKEQISSEDYLVNDRIRAYVVEVSRTISNIKMIISRTHPNLVKKLFEFEIPEIYEGIVEIKAIAREAGDRTKIAVTTESSNVDCVGACVGMKGARVKNIVSELRNEKIDIVRWNEDLVEFIKNSLAPAEINKIELDEKQKKCQVIVAEDQLSLAIGKRGQNARLAAKLTGWNIDIKVTESGKDASSVEASLFKSSKEVEEMQDQMKKAISEIATLPGVGEKAAKNLVEAGFTSIAQISEADIADLVAIDGIGEKLASKIIEAAMEKGGNA
jgi:transcription termination/antitermination protein NusA